MSVSQRNLQWKKKSKMFGNQKFKCNKFREISPRIFKKIVLHDKLIKNETFKICCFPMGNFSKKIEFSISPTHRDLQTTKPLTVKTNDTCYCRDSRKKNYRPRIEFENCDFLTFFRFPHNTLHHRFSHKDLRFA